MITSSNLPDLGTFGFMAYPTVLFCLAYLLVEGLLALFRRSKR